jgi:hypothetical protein
MNKEKGKVFREALDRTIVSGSDALYQVAYYAPDLDQMIESYGAMGAHGWRKFRRTEEFEIYPGEKGVVDGVFYVAHRHDYMPGLETELVQPLTDPNYIGILDLSPGQIAHLGVGGDRYPTEDDQQILRRLTGREGQAIQNGRVRKGGLTMNRYTQQYTIYQVDQFLPVKIVRSYK